jgi:hypothetical protein
MKNVNDEIGIQQKTIKKEIEEQVEEIPGEKEKEKRRCNIILDNMFVVCL